MTRILLRGGRVIDPASDWDGAADLLLVDGRIGGRARPGGFAAFADAEPIDCTGWWVVPGLIDPHVHLRDPGFPELSLIHI